MGLGSPKAPIVVGALSGIGDKHPQLRQLREEALPQVVIGEQLTGSVRNTHAVHRHQRTLGRADLISAASMIMLAAPMPQEL